MLLRQRYELKVILVLVITLLIFIWYMNKKEDWKANFNQLEKELSLKMKLISPQIVQTYNNSVPVNILKLFNYM
jgi:ABC-type transport system involved in Fe-S cluster assembly fused permease/ATPase subunit